MSLRSICDGLVDARLRMGLTSDDVAERISADGIPTRWDATLVVQRIEECHSVRVSDVLQYARAIQERVDFEHIVEVVAGQKDWHEVGRG